MEGDAQVSSPELNKKEAPAKADAPFNGAFVL
jgi:hypothetical protein